MAQDSNKIHKSLFGDPDKTLYLIDISSFIFRAFFAIRSLSNRKGEPTNAIYGVATMVSRLIEEANPRHLAVVYDSKEPSIRKEVYAEYKANRTAPPEDLVPQFDRIEELIGLFGICSYRQSGMEADDLIGTLAKRWCQLSRDHHVVVVSGDKDLMQLVDHRVCMWDTMNNKIYDAAAVEAKLGVSPTQVRDYLALVGDSSDNIPGVPSIGPKTAAELLKQYDSLDRVIEAAAGGKIPGKRGEVLRIHEGDARISAQLATIHTDLPVEVDDECARYEFKVTPECIEFLREMDFHTLVKKWGGEAQKAFSLEMSGQGEGAPQETRKAKFPDAGPPEQGGGGRSDEVAAQTTRFAAGASSEAGRFRLLNAEADFQKLLEQIEQTREFGFDLETTSLNPRQAELVGVAIAHSPDFGYYIPVGHRGTQVPQLSAQRVLDGLKAFLENEKYRKIGQNLKYDWSVLRELGLKPRGIHADTMVAAYVLEADGRHDMKTLAARYMDYNVLTYEEVCGKGKDQIGFDQVPVDLATRYSAEDAWVAVHLWEAVRPKLEAEGLMRIFAEVDLPLVDVLSRMELQGVCLDVDWLKKLSSEFSKELRAIEERIQAHTSRPVNLNSPKQLAVLLFDELKLPAQGKTKTGYSTDAKVLEALAPLHEVPRLLLEYREISKLKGTYVDPLPAMRDAKTGKIHASFHQAVTATGRLSSSDPNLQNIPIRSDRGMKIRRAFVPSQGNVLVAADYSQIELRLLAHMSGDPELVGAFQRDEDIHRRTASEIMGVPPEQVDDRSRGIAKAINFGLMYGKTAFGLAQELNISRREAADVIERYFTRYSAVKRFLDEQIIHAKEQGHVCTILGRKRYLPDVRSSNHALRANAERMAMNSPIQGAAADLIKLAMIDLDRELEKGGYKAKLTIQVHDEVLLDCPREEAKDVERLVKQVMENAMKLSVPLKVNSAIGDNWMEL